MSVADITSLLRVRLTAGYGSQRVLESIAFDLPAGERFGLVGASGEGKSTLVLALLGLLPWSGGWAQGEVMFDGHNLLKLSEREARKVRGKRIALVPQSPMSALNSAISLRRHFEECWLAHEPRLNEAFRARLAQLMQQVRLPVDAAFLNRKPGAVSVGQAQRAVLALALLHRPALLIADEPTSSLDPVTQIEILELLREINREDGVAILYISHDLLSVVRFCTTLSVLAGGRIVDAAPVAAMSAAIHPATRALLATLPVPLEDLLRHAGGD